MNTPLMKETFSEFSFGFAYTFELTTLWKTNLVESPILPSLIEEGKVGGGFDVALDTSFGQSGISLLRTVQTLATQKKKQRL